jgi:rhodanese-related sulfurtransferase
MTNDYISPAQLYNLRQGENSPFVIDVRSTEEYAAGHIAGAVHIPANELGDRLGEIPSDRSVVTY